ncbi:TraB family protein, partial [Methanocaldococcus sp.]
MENLKTYETRDGSKIYLLGTAHVSKDSVESVEKAIEEIEPDVVAVELDNKRFISLMSEENSKIDIKKALKSGDFLKTFLYIILAYSQRKIGESLGIKPGSEMKKAIEVANIKGIPIALIDRDVNITFSRLLNKLTFKDKTKLLFELFSDKEIEVDNNLLEEMKKNPKKYIELLKEISPKMYEVFVDERDRYMAKNLYEISKSKKEVLAIVGAGHVDGIIKYLKKLDNGEDIDISELIKVKEKKRINVGKILSYSLSLVVIAFFLYAIYYSFKNPNLLKLLTINWIIFTGGLSALGVLLARGKLITAIIAFISAPITTLIPLPLAAVGTITALVELKYREITDKDIAELLNAESIKSLLNNNLFKVLLVMTLSNLGASIGVFYCLGKFSG